MFDFRIIDTTDGNQIIDRNLKTPYDSLTPVQMIEYIELDAQMALMDSLEKKRKKQKERQLKLSRNPFYRLACMCGMV